MKIAAQISALKGYLPEESLKEFCSTLDMMGFDLQVPYGVENLMDAVKNDKKRGENGVDFVLLQEIGKSCIETISFEDLAKAAADVLH